MSEEGFSVALVGQPNVGKSALFSRLTGVGVVSSNYAGTTVEFLESVIIRRDTNISVRDLPGTYSLSKNSEDEGVVIDMLRDESPDAVIVVADSTNLTGSLVLCYEVLELGLPTIIALNKYDVARRRIDIDTDAMSAALGVPVCTVSAKSSEGVDKLLDIVCEKGARVCEPGIHYEEKIIRSANIIKDYFEDRTFSPYGIAIKSLEGTEDFHRRLPDSVHDNLELMRSVLSEAIGEPVEMSVARSRYAAADYLVRKCVSASKHQMTHRERISDLTVTPLTGIPILFAIFAAIFLTIIYVGSFLDSVVSSAYSWALGDALSEWGESLDPLARSVVEGINGSFSAILCLVIPYIMVFYILLGILEDSGYLTRVVVLLDTVMHRFGLHGGAAIPALVGVGCNVPAIMATRTIRTRRERLILSTLIITAVPCSAQVSIIMGITGKYAGMQFSFLIIGVLVCIGCLTGIVMNKLLPKEPSSLAMDLPELTAPQIGNVLRKCWMRIKDFFIIAFPLLVVGSIIIEIMLQYDVLSVIVQPFSFITETMLGLPPETIICFIVGILRKEMAVGMLAIVLGDGFAATLTAEQFVVFGMVMATYVPCIASLSVLWKEMGLKDMIIITFCSCMIALLLGTITHGMFVLFG